MPPVPIGVLGCGHMGRFHALKLAARGCLAGVHDSDPARTAMVAAETGAPALSLPALLDASAAVVVATPTAHHASGALAALAAGRHVLVEKPLAATLADAERIVAAAARSGTVLMVGHVERHSAAMAALRHAGLGRGALAYEAVRSAPFRPRGLDVSVVLDLMIHDLDLVLELAGAPLEAVRARGRAVVSPHTDFCQAQLRFADGGLATLTASRVGPSLERRLRVLHAGGEVRVDFLARAWEALRPGGAAAAAPDGWGIDRATWTEHDSLNAEHAAFLAAIAGAWPPEAADGAAGLRALDAALRVEAALAEG